MTEELWSTNSAYFITLYKDARKIFFFTSALRSFYPPIQWMK